MNPVVLFVLIGAALAVPYVGRPRPPYPGYGYSGPAFYKPQPYWPNTDYRTSRYTYRGPYETSQYQPYSMKNNVEDEETVIVYQDDSFQAGPYDRPIGPVRAPMNVRPNHPPVPVRQAAPTRFSPSAYGPRGYTKLTPYLISLKKPVGTVGEKDPLDNPIIYQIAKVTRGRMSEGEDQADDEEVDDESEEEEDGDDAQDDFVPTFDAPTYAPESYNIMKENFMKSKDEKKKVNSRAMTLAARTGMAGPYRRSPYTTYYQAPMRYGTPAMRPMMPMRIQNRNYQYVQQRPVYHSRPYTRPYAPVMSPAMYQRYGPSVPSTRRNYVQLKNKPVVYNINPYSQMIMPQRKM